MLDDNQGPATNNKALEAKLDGVERMFNRLMTPKRIWTMIFYTLKKNSEILMCVEPKLTMISEKDGIKDSTI